MRETTKIISMVTADTFGVCSAFYELGGMIVMHDASGCNSTYSTHDEPRWDKIKSEVYISALTEVDAVSGNDKKLIDDILTVANDLKPRFIVICGTPIPTMTGFDYDGVSKIIENKTGIKTFGISTTGMKDYVNGIEKSYQVMFSNFVGNDFYKNDIENIDSQKNESDFTGCKNINILGLTPLDYYYNVEDIELLNYLKVNNINVNCSFSAHTDLDKIINSTKADLNIVVSESGMKLAKLFKEKYNIDYKVKILIMNELVDMTKEAENFYDKRQKMNIDDMKIIDDDLCDSNHSENYIISEPFKAIALKKFLKEKLNIDINFLYRCSESELVNILKNAKLVIADGLYEPIVREDAYFINYPHAAFSGRLYDNEAKTLSKIFSEVKQNEKKFN